MACLTDAVMHGARVEPPWDVGAWRAQARAALLAGIPPERVSWGDANDGDLFATQAPARAPDRARLPEASAAERVHLPAVPASFLSLAENVLAHSDPRRHALLYRLLWRIIHGERGLLSDPLDPDVARVRTLEKTIRRDVHKMHAFVRFRAVPGHADSFVAWFEPEHQILDIAVPFFVRRFAGMRWAILTPYRSAVWDGEALAMGEGGTRDDAPSEDASESLWQAYYANIFNPARLNPRMMRQEMPQKYWKHLPETRQLPQLLRDAGARVQAMADRDAQVPAKPRMVRRALAAIAAQPPSGSLPSLREQARSCQACPLWQPATQTVFGEGPANARIVLVGEQPGDQEDLRGRPFVGPAGQLLDRALAELGIDRAQLYLTNAVKHFKFIRSGKVRLHAKANPAEQRACKPWLDAELAAIDPRIVVCLGATAARAVLGPGFELMRERGRLIPLGDGRQVLATVHPAWVLRQSDKEDAYRGLLADLSLL